MAYIVAVLGALGALLTILGAYMAERRRAVGRAVAAARLQLAEFIEARIRITHRSPLIMRRTATT